MWNITLRAGTMEWWNGGILEEYKSAINMNDIADFGLMNDDFELFLPTDRDFRPKNPFFNFGL